MPMCCVSRLPEDVLITGFGDDISVVVDTETEDEVECKVRQAAQGIVDWMEEHGLQVAADKTKVVVMSERKRVRRMGVEIKCILIYKSFSAKYVGVWLDKRRNFKLPINEA